MLLIINRKWVDMDNKLIFQAWLLLFMHQKNGFQSDSSLECNGIINEFFFLWGTMEINIEEWITCLKETFHECAK
jgi:hypothetical protein